jgi:hypothetical protein
VVEATVGGGATEVFLATFFSVTAGAGVEAGGATTGSEGAGVTFFTVFFAGVEAFTEVLVLDIFSADVPFFGDGDPTNFFRGRGWFAIWGVRFIFFFLKSCHKHVIKLSWKHRVLKIY